MSTPMIIRRIVHHPAHHGIEVDVDQELIQIPLVTDESCTISPLPQRPKHSLLRVVSSGCPLLKTSHRPIERDSPGLNSKVIVLCRALGYAELTTERGMKPGSFWFRTPHNR